MLKILKTFYEFLWTRKLLLVIFLFVVVISSASFAIMPYFYKLFVDSVASSSYDQSLNILIAYIGLSVWNVLISGLSFYLGDKIMIEAGSRIRQTIFKYVQDLDFVFHTTKSTGSLISIFKRGDGAFYSLFHAIHYRVIEVVVGFLIMVAAFASLHISIAIAAVIVFVLSMIVARFTIAYNVKTRSDFNEREDEISSVIVDNMIGFETVKLFAKEEWEQKRLSKTFVPWQRDFWRFGISFRYLDFSIGALMNLSVFLILLIGLQRVYQFELGAGDFVLIFAFLSVFQNRVYDLIWGLRDIAKSYTDIQRYFGLLDYDIKVKDPQNAAVLKDISASIDFKDIKFAYQKRKNSIREFSLKIKPGESVALVGRSGAGKTTITKLLMRFYDLDHGQIFIDGIDIKDMTKSDLRSLMGVVPQEPILFNHTIRYNIAYGNPKASMKEIKAAAKIANIGAFIEGLPEKYDTQVGERGIKLSGGQKQRLAIARMILANPKIVIFDEATSHLDSESEKLIQEGFWKAAKNKTTLIIAHRLSTVMRADKIVVMEKGKIVEVGTHNELINKEDSLYRYFWGLQAME